MKGPSLIGYFLSHTVPFMLHIISTLKCLQKVGLEALSSWQLFMPFSHYRRISSWQLCAHNFSFLFLLQISTTNSARLLLYYSVASPLKGFNVKVISSSDCENFATKRGSEFPSARGEKVSLNEWSRVVPVELIFSSLTHNFLLEKLASGHHQQKILLPRNTQFLVGLAQTLSKLTKLWWIQDS